MYLSICSTMLRPARPILSAFRRQIIRRLSSMVEKGDKIVARDDMHRFLVELMRKQGVNPSHCEQLADVLVEADVRGQYSHGLNRIDMYIRDVAKKVCCPDGTPKILKEQAGTAWVDGNNLLGPVVGNFCMDLAIKKAKEAGVGWVVAKGSNHFGICGWYVMRAMREGLLGMCFTNTSPVMFPTRAAVKALGTNPLSLGANGTGGDSYLLDMATSAVAIGKVEMQKRKNEPVPPMWGAGKGGVPTNSPDDILNGGGLYPLGGDEINGGYKGYGLAALVEIFCGILGGSHWGPNVRNWMAVTEEADLGQCWVAVDPEAFAPGFHGRMQEFMETMRNLPPVNPSEKVLVAGDKERAHEALVKELGGIPYHPNQIEFANHLAEEYGVKQVKVVKEC